MPRPNPIGTAQVVLPGIAGEVIANAFLAAGFAIENPRGLVRETRSGVRDSEATTLDSLLAVARATTASEAATRALEAMGLPREQLAFARCLWPSGSAWTPAAVASDAQPATGIDAGSARFVTPLAPGVDLVSTSSEPYEPDDIARIAAALLVRFAMPSPAVVEMLLRLDHDLRSPLCAISLNLHLLDARLAAAPQPDDGLLSSIRSIARSASRITESIDEITRAKREARATAGIEQHPASFVGTKP